MLLRSPAELISTLVTLVTLLQEPKEKIKPVRNVSQEDNVNLAFSIIAENVAFVSSLSFSLSKVNFKKVNSEFYGSCVLLTENSFRTLVIPTVWYYLTWQSFHLATQLTKIHLTTVNDCNVPLNTKLIKEYR